jgi:hypothetical protein
VIIYTFSSREYFDLYFDLWISQINKFYPKFEKVIYVYNSNQQVMDKCKKYNVTLEEPYKFKNPDSRHFYLSRWLNLPYHYNEKILSTQITCMPIKTQDFRNLDKVDHIRISRRKKHKLGGISAAIFTPAAAIKISTQAHEFLKDLPDTDHDINSWQEKNLSNKLILAEQQFKTKDKKIDNYTCWITAGTSMYYTSSEKLEILKYYIKKSEG